MQTLKRSILAILLCVLALGLPALAQDSEVLPPLAAVQNDNVWLFDPSGESQQITDGSAVFYSNLVWSSDGNYLAFIQRDQDFNANLMLYDRANNTLTQVDPDIADGFHIGFSFDSSQLFYIKDDPSNGTNPEYKMHFYTYDLVPNASPTQVASFDFGVGCGGGSPFPGDLRYGAETQGFGGFHLILAVTPFGLVHSMDCGGSETGLLNLQTGEDISLGQLSRAVVSPDGTKVAGIIDLAGTRTDEKLVVVDLETREATQYDTIGTPDQVVWGMQWSSEVFYSTREVTDQPLSFTQEELDRIHTVFGETTLEVSNEVSIHHFDLTSGEDTELYRTVAYAIGSMIPQADRLIFSQVQSGETWLRAIAEGRLDMSDPEAFENSDSLVQVELYSLPIAGGEAALLGTDLNQVALNPVAVSG
jgi:hypothetical protein